MRRYVIALLVFLGLLYTGKRLHAEEIYVARQPLGSGITNDYEKAYTLPDNLVHVPNYLPGFPTAATIWPRVVTVTCSDDGSRVLCNGYNVNQYSTGRGEYLYTQPVIVKLAVVAPIAPVIPSSPAVIKILKHKKRVFQCKP
jgi:hypothetical protein